MSKATTAAPIAVQDPSCTGLASPLNSAAEGEDSAAEEAASVVAKLPSGVIATDPVAGDVVVAGEGAAGVLVVAGDEGVEAVVASTGGALIGPTASRQNFSAAGNT